MPLSENEQKILAEIEKGLNVTDPKFAKGVEGSALYRKALGSMKLPIAGVLVGFVVMVSMILVHFLLSFIGFVILFVSALGIERHLRLIGSAGMKDLSATIKSSRDLFK